MLVQHFEAKPQKKTTSRHPRLNILPLNVVISLNHLDLNESVFLS